jgi:transposase
MTERVIDVVPGLVVGHKADGRCVYDPAVKRELVRRCLQPGVSVAATALAHGINANLLRLWITRSGDSVNNGPEAVTPVLLPVRTQQTPAMLPHAQSEIEVVLPMGSIRIRGQVCGQSLQVVIDCLSRRP